MSHLLLHVVLHALGATAACLLAAVGLQAFRHDPRAAHRLLRATVLALVILPVLQVAVAGRLATEASRPFSALVDELFPDRGTENVTPADDGILVDELSELLAAEALLELAAPDRGMIAPEAPERAVVASTTSTAGLDAERLAAWILVPYLAGVMLGLGRLARRVLTTRRLLARARPVKDPEVLALWDRLRCQSPRVRNVPLLATAEITTPSCAGILRPVILLPGSLLHRHSERSLEYALRHERHHLEQRDPFFSIVQALATLLLWFHPAVWWLARRLELQRELACDLAVVAETGSRRRYARALLDHAALAAPGLGSGSSPCPAFLAWNRSPGLLHRRIDMLIQTSSSPRGRLRLAAFGIFVLLLGALWSGQVGAAAVLFPGPVPQEVEQPAPPAERPPGVVDGGGLRLGISVVESREEIAEHPGLPAQEVLVISEVARGSPAARAGVRPRDVIVKIDGESPATFERLEAARDRLRRGELVRLSLQRGESTLCAALMPFQEPDRAEVIQEIDEAPESSLHRGLLRSVMERIEKRLRQRVELDDDLRAVILDNVRLEIERTFRTMHGNAADGHDREAAKRRAVAKDLMALAEQEARRGDAKAAAEHYRRLAELERTHQHRDALRALFDQGKFDPEHIRRHAEEVLQRIEEMKSDRSDQENPIEYLHKELERAYEALRRVEQKLMQTPDSESLRDQLRNNLERHSLHRLFERRARDSSEAKDEPAEALHDTQLKTFENALRPVELEWRQHPDSESLRDQLRNNLERLSLLGLFERDSQSSPEPRGEPAEAEHHTPLTTLEEALRRADAAAQEAERLRNMGPSDPAGEPHPTPKPAPRRFLR